MGNHLEPLNCVNALEEGLPAPGGEDHHIAQLAHAERGDRECLGNKLNKPNTNYKEIDIFLHCQKYKLYIA